MIHDILMKETLTEPLAPTIHDTQIKNNKVNATKANTLLKKNTVGILVLSNAREWSEVCITKTTPLQACRLVILKGRTHLSHATAVETQRS